MSGEGCRPKDVTAAVFCEVNGSENERGGVGKEALIGTTVDAEFEAAERGGDVGAGENRVAVGAIAVLGEQDVGAGGG